MALGNQWTNIASGSQTINGATLTYYIDAYLSSQSIASNQSVCPIRARTAFSGYYMQSYGYNFTATGCSSKSGTGLYSFTTETVLTGSVTVTHNADGTGRLNVSGVCQGSGIGLNISVSGSVALPTIPRASKPTVSNNPLTIGNTQTITTNRAVSSFTHRIVISMGNYSQTYTDVGASVQWTADTATMMPYMDTWQQTVTISCTTYNGSTQIGSTQTTTFTLQMDTTVYKPVIGTVALSDTNSTTASLESSGTFIKGYSSLQAVIPLSVASTDYNCALYRATVTYNGQTSTYNLSGTSQSITFTASVVTSELVIKVMDNRGYEVTKTVNLTLIDYQPLSVISVSYVRVNANDAETETGEYVRYTIVANAFLGSFGQATNQITVKSKSKAASASSYGTQVTEKTVTTSGSGNAQTTITGVTVGTYSPSSQFDIIFELSDALSDAEALPLRVHEGVPVYAWGEDHFDVYGTFHIHDRDDITKYISLNGLNPSTEAVTFSGAQGGSVNWNVFAYGSLRICTAKWSDASNRSCSTAWGGMYTCTRFDTPDYPVNFSAIHYENMQMVQADANANYSAIVIPQLGSTLNLTSYGEVFLARGSTSTIGHPIYVQIVVGTV